MVIKMTHLPSHQVKQMIHFLHIFKHVFILLVFFTEKSARWCWGKFINSTISINTKYLDRTPSSKFCINISVFSFLTKFIKTKNKKLLLLVVSLLIFLNTHCFQYTYEPVFPHILCTSWQRLTRNCKLWPVSTKSLRGRPHIPDGHAPFALIL